MRNKHIDIMLGFGIIMVVMGHRYQPENLFYPAYTFHMALFFFISGYLATIKNGVKDKLSFIYRKTKSQLFKYYAYNLLFGVITFLLALAGLKMGYQVPAFGSGSETLDTIRNFFVIPLQDGHHYHLYLAAWFILQLYIVHLVFQLIFFSDDKRLVYAVFIVLIPVTLFLLKKGLVNYTDFRLTGVRTSFALLFYLVGYIVKREEERIGWLLRSPWTLLVCFASVDVLSINFGNVNYNIVLGNIANENVAVPVITTLLIVIIVYQLSYYAARFISDSSILLTIGKSTLTILIWHFTVFFLINAVLYTLGLITKENLANNWFVFEDKKTWLLYIPAGIMVPLYLKYLYQRYVKKSPVTGKLYAG